MGSVQSCSIFPNLHIIGSQLQLSVELVLFETLVDYNRDSLGEFAQAIHNTLEI